MKAKKRIFEGLPDEHSKIVPPLFYSSSSLYDDIKSDHFDTETKAKRGLAGAICLYEQVSSI